VFDGSRTAPFQGFRFHSVLLDLVKSRSICGVNAGFAPGVTHRRLAYENDDQPRQRVAHPSTGSTIVGCTVMPKPIADRSDIRSWNAPG
jgi:hypothetical protein